MGTASVDDGTEAAKSAQPNSASQWIGAYTSPRVADYSELHLEEWHEAQEECISKEEEAPQDGPCWKPCLEQIPTREQIASSTSSPALVVADAGVPQRILNADPAHLPVNCGTPIEFSSDSFAGRACVYIRGLPGSPAAVFDGLKRRTVMVVQGSFRKEGLGFDAITTGQEFDRASTLPPSWLVSRVLQKVAQLVDPSMDLGPLHKPFFLMPVVAGANAIHVARPGQEPPMAAAPQEDMRLVDPALVQADGSPVPVSQRRAFFSSLENRAGRTFSRAYVWTFYVYQHLVDVSRYELDVLYRFNLCRHLDGQPLQLMMKDRVSGAFLFRFLMWHEGLLPAAERRAAKQRDAAGTADK